MWPQARCWMAPWGHQDCQDYRSMHPWVHDGLHQAHLGGAANHHSAVPEGDWGKRLQRPKNQLGEKKNLPGSSLVALHVTVKVKRAESGVIGPKVVLIHFGAGSRFVALQVTESGVIGSKAALIHFGASEAVEVQDKIARKRRIFGNWGGKSERR